MIDYETNDFIKDIQNKIKEQELYKEEDNKVEISLKKKDKFVYCPVLILDRILYWKNKQSAK